MLLNLYNYTLMIEMDVMWILLASTLICGAIGAFGRMLFQWKRDGEFPGKKEWEFSVIMELFLGGFIGLITWMITLIVALPETWIMPHVWLTTIAVGYAGVDAMEAILKKYVPEG